MKTLKFYLFAAAAILLSSCGSSTPTVTPVSEKIQGPLGEYFEVVNKDYKINYTGKISVEIKRIKAGFPEPWEKGMEVGYDDHTFSPLFSVEFLDGDGNVVGKDVSDIVDDEGELKSIAVLGVGESASLTFDCPEGAKQLKVSSTFEVNIDDSSDESDYETETTDDSYESSETAEETSGSENWDELLRSYEEYVDKYISFAKKAAKGDMSALSEYPAIMEKAQEYCDQLENAKNDMSASQLAKYNKITSKLTKAAQNM